MACKFQKCGHCAALFLLASFTCNGRKYRRTAVPILPPLTCQGRTWDPPTPAWLLKYPVRDSLAHAVNETDTNL